MPTNYTPVATALTTITLPSDGDQRSAASVNLPMQQLANAIARYPNRFVGVSQFGLTSNATTTSTTIADVTGVTTSLAVVTGDIIMIDAIAYYNVSTASNVGLDLMIVDGGTSYPFGCYTVASATTGDQIGRPQNGTWVALNTGTLTVKLRAIVTAGTLTIFGAANNTVAPQTRIRLTQFRP